MKSLRFMLSVVLMSLSTVALAQYDAQKSFDKLKTLAGSWEGYVTTLPQQPEIEGKLTQVSLRATSMGNALRHEMTGAGRPDDPITMLYLDGDRLLLTHYCDAGNRPRMVGKMSLDGKTVGIRFPGCRWWHLLRTHAPCSLYRDRREPSHRGLDLHAAGG
jgi:hypothetical protein